tara:strand:+ start:7314 stop:7571 length:258 start_codon:yes stop_codon:yes gene_type:complete
MCSTFKIAREVIDELVDKKDPFTLENVREQIIAKNGVHRVAAGVTTKDYLDILEERDIIVYDFSTMKYYNVSVLEETRQENLANL